jgi:4'-phosphopantetheinyl transferase EntD
MNSMGAAQPAVNYSLLFRPMLPDTVRVAEMLPADADPALLFPDEARSVERAVEKRRREFAAGRLLARELFAQMTSNETVRSASLLNDVNRVPVWPAGIVGSITHCRSLCAVAMTHAAHSAGIGLDVEPAEPMNEEIERYVMRDAEYARLDVMPHEVRTLGSLLVFSIKEAVYKAIYPIRRRFLEFQEVEIMALGIAPEIHVGHRASGIAMDAQSFCGDFEAQVLVAEAAIPGIALITGRYRIADGHIAAAVVLPPADAQYSDTPHAEVERVFEQGARTGFRSER